MGVKKDKMEMAKYLSKMHLKAICSITGLPKEQIEVLKKCTLDEITVANF